MRGLLSPGFPPLFTGAPGMDAGGKLEGVYRDPRIKISGRDCFLCHNVAPVALVLNFRGRFTGLLMLCARCVIRVAEKMARREDAILNIDIGGGSPLELNLGQRQN